MSAALAIQSRPVMLEVHQLLRELDPARFRQEFAEAARERMGALAQELAQALETYAAEESESDVLSERLRSFASLLSQRAPDESLSLTEAEAAWAGYRKELQVAYEDLSEALRQWSVQVPTLRPTNYKRSLVHMASGVGVLMLIEYVLSPRAMAIVPTTFATIFWGMEISRRYSDKANEMMLKVLGPIAHPHEHHRVNSSTWYGTALAILGLAFDPMACALGVAVLAFADPAAATVGRAFGKTKLVNQKSLEGSLAFAVVGACAALLTLTIWHSSIPWSSRLVVALAAAVAGAIAELFSGRLVDDNLAVPVASGAAASLALYLS